MPDIVLALGGDGTLLSAMDCFAQVPIMGINYGTVGFLTSANEHELEDAITALKNGSFEMEERTLLEIHHKGVTYLAFNEAVIKGLTKVVTLDLHIDGMHINTLRGDGVIVGTPSGSTAYLLATGTPIVSPKVDCFIIAALNEYSLTRHSMIVDCSRELSITLKGPMRGNHVYLVYDGKPEIIMEEGDEVRIKRAPFSARLLFLHKNHFFHSVKKKLKYGECNPG